MPMFKEALQKKKKRTKEVDTDTLVGMHHILMKHYGWIPLEEFKRLPACTVMNLLYKIQEDDHNIMPQPVVLVDPKKYKKSHGTK